MLYLEYPEVFEISKYGIKFKEEYRGISDILNGMSNGDILMGYSHKTDYWKKSGRLEKESWAQYGRMFYTDGKALEMAKKIFPEMSHGEGSYKAYVRDIKKSLKLKKELPDFIE